MFETLKRNWKLFLRSPTGRRFRDFHDRRKAQKGKGHSGKLLMISGVVIAILGLALLPLPGPGSVVLIGGLMLLAAESMTMARMLDYADKKRANLMSRVRRICKRLGTLKCILLGMCIALILLAGGIALWHWLT